MTTFIFSTLSLVISIVSFLGAKKAERYIGLRNELSNLPAVIPEKRTNPRGGTVGLLIKNRGAGIAIIEKLLVTHKPSFTVDAAQNSNWLNDLKSILKGAASNNQDVREINENVTPVKNVYTASAMSGSVLNIGEEFWLIQGDPDNLSANKIQTVIGWLNNLDVRVIYSSVYMKQFDSNERYEVFIQRINKFYQSWISKRVERLRK